MPGVSVVIPTYNSVDTVTRAIDSVLAQTFTDYEVIVVDDGSTDGTASRLEPYKDRIQYIYQENRERSAARNTGVNHSRGEYIAFLDADDTWLPTKLERQMEIFHSQAHVGMVYCLAYLVDALGKAFGIAGKVLENLPNPEDQYLQLILGNYIPAPTPVIHRACWERTGGFDEALNQGEDWDYWLRIGRNFSIAGVAEPLANYSVTNPETLLQKMAARKAQDAHIQIMDKARKAGGCPDSVFDLAEALAWLDGALIDLGLGNQDAGLQRVKRAVQYERQLLTEYEDLVINRIVNLATQLCLGQKSADNGLNFLSRIWGALPPEFDPEALLKKSTYLLLVARFYQASQAKNLSLMLNSLKAMLIKDAGSIFNRGIWSVSVHTLIDAMKEIPRPSDNKTIYFTNEQISPSEKFFPRS